VKVRFQGTPPPVRRGSALVEFGLVSLLLYVLLAGGIELGRMVYTAQVLNDAARLAARELALAPLPEDATLEQALLDDYVRARVFDETRLVIPSAQDGACEFEGTTGDLPLVNRALVPLMIVERVAVNGSQTCVLRYPGALLFDGTTLRVGIPKVVARTDPDPGDPGRTLGIETIEWRRVLEEMPCPAGPVFPLNSPCAQSGVAAIVLNYPFQAAGLVGYRSLGAGTFDSNFDNRIIADDGAVSEVNPEDAPGDPVNAEAVGTYAGPYGLGRQLAYGRTVRPFRRLISAQAIFRREVFQ
jgi:hypothetical protein